MMKTSELSAVDWEQARQRAGARARRWWPVALSLFIGIVVTLAVAEVLKPLLWQVREWRALGPGEGVTLREVLGWLSLRALRAAPALALAAAVGATVGYLRHLGAGGLWDAATSRLLRRVGSALVFSAAFTTVVVPTGTRWLAARGGFDFEISTVAVALGVLGGLLIVVADLLKDVLQTAHALKADSDSFV